MIHTPIELFQYINMNASFGEKRHPQLMKGIIDIKKNEYKIISRDLDNKYLNR